MKTSISQCYVDSSRTSNENNQCYVDSSHQNFTNLYEKWNKFNENKYFAMLRW